MTKAVVKEDALNRSIFLERILRAAGEDLNASCSQKHQFKCKGVDGIVTEADNRTAELLISSINREFPGEVIVCEDIQEKSDPTGGRWIIDPIDGTTNFASSLPFFTVSGAFYDGDVAIASAVYVPRFNLMFGAIGAARSNCNGRLCSVSDRTDAGEAVILTGMSHKLAGNREQIDTFINLSTLTRGTRRSGCATLDICFVASGQGDAYYHPSLHIWDTAAAAHIAKNAGASLSDRRGKPYILAHGAILVSNPFLTPKLINIINMVERSSPI